MMTEAKPILAQQALHGYSEGHSLIASSVELDGESSRTMSILSDMSGPSMQSGFESYISGYPLDDLRMYAIAKTWYAPEMSRPGCVWTHTILINFSDLVHIKNPLQFLKAFKRPILTEGFDKYRRPKIIEWSEYPPLLNENGKDYEKFVRSVLFHLYWTPRTSVMLGSNASIKFEDLVLCLWLQQWPRLRRNFSFCTGAISMRTFRGKPFDIQVTPASVHELNPEERESLVYLLPNTNQTHDLQNQILDAVCSDLFSPDVSLRTFMMVFGADIAGDRASVSKLIPYYQYLSGAGMQNNGVAEIIDQLRQHFPHPREARQLKGLVLDPSNLPRQPRVRFAEEEILAELSITKYEKHFDFEHLRFPERFLRLLDSDQIQALQTIDQLTVNGLNRHGASAIEAFAATINSDAIRSLNLKYRRLLLIFTSLNPTISYEMEYWSGGKSEHEENFDQLIKVDGENPIDWEKVIQAMLLASARIPEFLVERLGHQAIFAILDRANSPEIFGIIPQYLTYLKSREKYVVEWLSSKYEIGTEILRAIPDILNPNSKELNGYDSIVWLHISKSNLSGLQPKERIRFMAFFFVLAMRASDSKSFDLLCVSFESTYFAQYNDKLDYESWRHIEPYTSPLSLWNDWDKCKKLRRAVVKKFLAMNWPMNSFNLLTTDKTLIGQLRGRYQASF